jgi:hypothetical protein
LRGFFISGPSKQAGNCLSLVFTFRFRFRFRFSERQRRRDATLHVTGNLRDLTA